MKNMQYVNFKNVIALADIYITTPYIYNMFNIMNRWIKQLHFTILFRFRCKTKKISWDWTFKFPL